MKARSEVVKGAYFLVIFLTAGENRKKIPIGKLGTFYFPAGFYIYVGSALNGLDARITRHLSKNKKKRWHIDYFLDRATVIGVARFETATRIECTLNRVIADYADRGGRCIMPKFGSTDCACETHLHYFETCDVAALISYVKKSAVARYFDCYETLAQRAKRKAVNSV